ncbi:hypothetical protein FKW77_002980 [Venturia effusa]|uniref:Arrestin-like N-terminal domain-containing protein n=1 Tax=Venturia effusa TaxID=50376 RepID=A0A517LF34_9PEZI|nr:hypothetical protein FKW77_002980 [Venturia effusa]
MAAEIIINLHKALDHIYSPGETVAGCVVFTPQFNCKLKEMKVSFKGECYTSSLGSDAKVSNAVPLFGIVCDLIKEVYTYQGCAYEASFAFEFPSDTTLTNEAGPKALSALFNQEPQLLPNSFVLSMRNTLQMVRYFIQVELYGRTRALTEQALLFRQPSSASDNYWDDFEEDFVPGRLIRRNESLMQAEAKYTHTRRPLTCRSSNMDGTRGAQLFLHALPIMKSHHRSVHERYEDAKLLHKRKYMEWLFKPWKMPKISFMPGIYLPQRVAVNETISLLLVIDTHRNKELLQAPRHPFVLRGFSVAIIAHTRTIMQNRPSKHRWGRCMELPYQVIEVYGLYHELPIDGEPVPLVDRFRVLPGTIPSFSTYTINRSYSVNVFLKFNYDGDELEWTASMALDIFSDNTLPPVRGKDLDPLLSANPRLQPEYFWNSRVEAGAAESTGRANIRSTDDPVDGIGLEWEQWHIGHGRIPRSGYGCATAEVAGGLQPARTKKKKGAAIGNQISVIRGVCGRPSRRYLKSLEPVLAPLGGFRGQWFGGDGGVGGERSLKALDLAVGGGGGSQVGTNEGRESQADFMTIDECGVMSLAVSEASMSRSRSGVRSRATSRSCQS